MRALVIVAISAIAILAAPAFGEEVQRCTTGDHCVHGILVSDKPTAAQIKAIDQAMKAKNAAAEDAQSGVYDRMFLKFSEPMPGDSEGVTMAKASSSCADNGKYCIDNAVEQRRKMEKIWEYIDLNAETRAKIREIIARRSAAGATDWPEVNYDYNKWLLITGRMPPTPAPSSRYTNSGIHSGCTLRTTTTGTPGNQVITSNLDCN